MFIILLKFSGNRASAPAHMAGHKAWIKKGMEDGIFLLVGSLQPGAGGAIVAQCSDRATLEALIQADPFVAEDIVTADILEITPNMADARLSFLLPAQEASQ